MSDFFKSVGNLEEPFLISEIGINHNGDLSIAKKLIDATNACGWHCTKFQKRNPDISVPEHQKNILRETPWGEMSYIDYKYKVEFEKKEYDLIDKYCANKSLPWTVSVWDLDSLNFINNYDVPFIKIPSAHITNIDLLRESAKSGLPILLSTGMSDWQIVDQAVELVGKYCSDFAILHCNSTYPSPINELNLSVIPVMKERYGCIVGYSGHEFGLEPSVIAVGLGAQIIERHITIDHNMWGTDQKSSLEVHAMDMLAKRLKDVNHMLGIPEKIITESEKPFLTKLRG
jgi:N-acetylneuraminate synthase